MTKNNLALLQKYAFLALSGLALLPFCILAFCNHPVGIHEWDWVSNLGGEFDNQSFWAYQKDSYMVNGGRFSSAALMSLTPYWYTIFNFQALFCIFILLFVLFLYFLLKKIYQEDNFKMPLLYLTLGILLAYFTTVSSVFDSVFRFSAILTYQIGFLFLLIFLTYSIPAFYEKKMSNTNLFVCTLLGFALPGFNEISMIAVCYLGIILSFFYWKKNKNIPNWLIIIALSIAFSCIIAIFAPGNFHRSGEYQADNFGLIKCIVLTFACSIFSIFSWFSNAQLILLALLSFPTLLYFAQKEQVQKVFNKPFTALLLTFLFVPLAYFPLLYGTKGASFAERVIDLTFLHCCLGWFYTLQSLAVSVTSRYPNILFWTKTKEVQVASLFIGGCLFLNIFANNLSINREENVAKITDRIQTNANVGKAWKIILDGSAKKYDTQMMTQYECIKSCKSDTCEVKMPTFFPEQLYEKISDRRHRPQGDHFMGKALGTNVKSVRYVK